MQFRLLEHYASFQGEGPRTGGATQFVRFAGCNLRCAGWPCDTPFAIEPNLFMKERKLIFKADLIQAIDAMAKDTFAYNVCLTGGEPMLQPTQELERLVHVLATDSPFTVEMFSNGTLSYPRTIMESCGIRMDWKLTGSGEALIERERVARMVNFQDMCEFDHHTIKFTIKNEDDFNEALDIYTETIQADWVGDIYAGVVWDQEYQTKDLAAAILKNALPWNLNVQVHNYVWPAHERAR